MARRVLIMVMLINMSACRPPRQAAAKSGMHQLAGTVLTADGRPAVDSIVILAEPSEVNEVALARTDAMGHFVASSPLSQVVVTATTNQEWGFLPKVDIGSGEIQIKLNRSCSLLRGRIVLDDPPPWPKVDVLRIGGFDDGVRGLFGIAVAGDYQFEACFPPTEYYIRFPQGFVKQTILARIPDGQPLVVRSVSQRAAETLPPASLHIVPKTRAAFVNDLPASVRLLGIGESNHGSNEFNGERTDLAIALARHRQFNLILLEAGYGEVLALDDYIKGRDVPLVQAIGKLEYFMWRTKTFRDSLDELREYNRSAPRDRRITLRGVDMRSTAGAIDDLMSSGDRISEREAELLARLRERGGARWVEFSVDEQTSLRRALEQLAVDRDSHGLDSPRNRHAVSARALLLSLELVMQQGFWNYRRVRDRGMAQLSQELLGLAPDTRATLWAHLMHIAREYNAGVPSLGGHLASSLGRDYRAYALLAIAGAARARDSDKDRGVIPHVLPRAPAYTLESVLAAATFSDDITYWTFDQAGASTTRWLHGLRFVRLFGSLYPANDFPFEILDLKALDGAVLFPVVTSTEPIADNATASGQSGPR